MVELKKRKKGYRHCKDCDKRLSKRNQYPSCIKQGQNYCKSCWNQRFYHAVRKHKYGLSKKEYWDKIESQHKKCAICNCWLEERKTAVDHNHINNEIRGILCTACNSGIGMLKDTSDIVYRAYLYLKKYNC